MKAGVEFIISLDVHVELVFGDHPITSTVQTYHNSPFCKYPVDAPCRFQHLYTIYMILSGAEQANPIYEKY